LAALARRRWVVLWVCCRLAFWLPRPRPAAALNANPVDPIISGIHQRAKATTAISK
jgi:hypothetical protein